jgi:hypothetical protein
MAEGAERDDAVSLACFFPAAHPKKRSQTHARICTLATPVMQLYLAQSHHRRTQSTRTIVLIMASALSVKMPFRVCISVRVYVSPHINRHPQRSSARTSNLCPPACRPATIKLVLFNGTEHRERVGFLERR